MPSQYCITNFESLWNQYYYFLQTKINVVIFYFQVDVFHKSTPIRQPYDDNICCFPYIFENLDKENKPTNATRQIISWEVGIYNRPIYITSAFLLLLFPFQLSTRKIFLFHLCTTLEHPDDQKWYQYSYSSGKNWT